jgi:hypothetical protein
MSPVCEEDTDQFHRVAFQGLAPRRDVVVMRKGLPLELLQVRNGLKPLVVEDVTPLNVLDRFCML